MDDKYKRWIEENVEDDGYGLCVQATERMAKEFPELTRIRGHYYCPVWGERTHWWMITKTGEIVDPTSSQFPSKGSGHYEPWDENQKEPTGKCPNCGSYCYDGKQTCSDSCYDEYLNYLNDLT